MSTHNIDFYEDLTKIIFELSSNTHLISSAAIGLNCCISFLFGICFENGLGVCLKGIYEYSPISLTLPVDLT